MKPFSAFYYIKENKKRALTLIFMIATIAICYLGELYVTNPMDAYKDACEPLKGSTVILPTYDDIDNVQLEAAKAEVNELLTQGEISYILDFSNQNQLYLNSVMSFEMDTPMATLKGQEDFNIYNSIFKIMPQEYIVQDKQVLLSEQMAKHFGKEVGDTISPTEKGVLRLTGEFTVGGIYKAKGMEGVFIDSEAYFGNGFMLLRNESHLADASKEEQAFAELSEQLVEKYPMLYFSTFSELTQTVEKQMASFDLIYFGIVAMLTFVLAITVNATFVGAYDRRMYEFSVYKALGFSQREISKKIIKEILLINLLGVLVGGVIIIAGVYLVNEMLLYPSGLFLSYFKVEGLIAALVCDLIIIIPVIISKTRQSRKYDISEY